MRGVEDKSVQLREVSWGITKLRVDWDCAINVSEALAVAAAQAGVERAEECPSCELSMYYE